VRFGTNSRDSSGLVCCSKNPSKPARLG